MTRRNPNIRIHRHSLSLLDEPERVRATRRGEVMHYALGLLGSPEGSRQRDSGRGAAVLPGEARDSQFQQRIEASVIKAFAALNLDPGPWNIRDDFVRQLLRVFQLAEFRAWFGAASLREAEIMDAAGDIHRPDRIVIKDGGIEVIDFKVGKREDVHKEQVRTYVGLLAEVFEGKEGKPVAGHLVYIDEPALVEVK